MLTLWHVGVYCLVFVVVVCVCPLLASRPVVSECRDPTSCSPRDSFEREKSVRLVTLITILQTDPCTDLVFARFLLACYSHECDHQNLMPVMHSQPLEMESHK